MTNPLIEDRMLGPSAPQLGWVPAPRYLLRRHRILRQLRGAAPGQVVEIGSGAGMLLQELAERGHSCHALETSRQARDLIGKLSLASGQPIEVHAEPQQHWAMHFPLVMAFEVLEHIEDDAAALREWASWLAPGGTLLMSVPAHPRQWNAADIWAGHFRRYRKSELIDLVASTGLELEHIECIGFPLGNLTERVQARGVARRFKQSGDQGARQDNNDRSGIERGDVLRWYPLISSAPGKLALQGAFALQAAFQRLPLGNGYLLRATKPR
ncbi:class I SAM-dependent methyltransferase [Lysobacter sp. A286]